MERLPAIDICRGIAIICMVAADIPMMVTVGFVQVFSAILAAPFFLFIAGMSYELFVISRYERRKSPAVLHIETFWRAVLLLAITQGIYLVGVLVFPAKYPLGVNSSIFLSIALGYLLSIFLPSRLIFHLPVIAATFLITHSFGSPTPGTASFFFSDPFPVMPFIAYFFAGRAIMILYQDIHDPGMRDSRITCISGGFVALVMVAFLTFPLPSELLKKTELAGFLLLCGVMIFLQSFLSVCIDRVRRVEFYLSPVERIGRISFSVYYIFSALEIIVFPYLNREFLGYLEPGSQILVYYLSILLIIIAAAVLEKFWRDAGYKGSVEWVLRYGSSLLTKGTLQRFSGGT